LDLAVGKGAVGADRALVDESAPLDGHRSAVDRNFRIAKAPVGGRVTNAQLLHLARTTAHRVLMALAAGLRVVERTEPIGDCLKLVEHAEIALVRRLIREAVAFVVEAGGRRGRGGTAQHAAGSTANTATPTTVFLGPLG